MNRRQIFTAPIIGGGGAVKPIAGGLWYGWMPSNIDGDGTVALDKIGTLTDANYVDNACLLWTGPETLTVPGLLGSETITLETGSTSTPTAGVGSISFTAGTCFGIYIDAVLTYTCAEVTGTTVYDITGASNDATLSTDTVRSTSDLATPWQIREGFSRPSDLFIATEPDGGWLRTYNPIGTDAGTTFDVLATLIEDATGTAGTWTVTEPTGGWLRSFNPNTASLQNLADVVATLANDMPSTVEAYTLTAPTTDLYTFNPETSSTFDAYDVLATLLVDLQTYGVIG